MTNNNNVCENAKEETENTEELERAIVRRKGFRSYLEVMTTICLVFIGVLSVLIAFPLPREILDKKLTFFFIMELISFFPVINIYGMILSISGKNTRSNSDIIIHILIYSGTYFLLCNVAVLFFSKYFG